MDLDLDLELDSSQYLVNVEDRFNPKCLGMGSKRAALTKNAYISATVGGKFLKKMCMGHKFSWLTFLLQAFFDSISN